MQSKGGRIREIWCEKFVLRFRQKSTRERALKRIRWNSFFWNYYRFCDLIGSWPNNYKFFIPTEKISIKKFFDGKKIISVKLMILCYILYKCINYEITCSDLKYFATIAYSADSEDSVRKAKMLSISSLKICYFQYKINYAQSTACTKRLCIF